MVIAYGSMYGNTAQMAEKIARELAVQGVKNIIVYNLSYVNACIAKANCQNVYVIAIRR